MESNMDEQVMMIMMNERMMMMMIMMNERMMMVMIMMNEWMMMTLLNVGDTDGDNYGHMMNTLGSTSHHCQPLEFVSYLANLCQLDFNKTWQNVNALQAFSTVSTGVWAYRVDPRWSMVHRSRPFIFIKLFNFY